MRDRSSSDITSFSTIFIFSITQGQVTNRSGWQVYCSGFGFTFLQENPSYICYEKCQEYDVDYTSSENFFAVEFDTYSYLFNDQSDNHVGVNVNSLDSLYTYNLCGDQVVSCFFSMDQPTIHNLD